MPITLTVPRPLSPPVIPPGAAQDVTFIRENYPNVGQKITQAWGTSELHRYLGSLIFDERGGRHGFPATIISALFRLYETDRKMIPDAANGDIWDVVLERLA